MKPVLVLQHVRRETLGSLESVLRQAGLTWQYVELFTGVPERLDLDRASGLIVLGGPMNVDETDRYPFLAAEVQWIRQAVQRSLPMLGICLGSQLLAKAFGARVFPNPVKEIGWYEVELTPAAAEDLLFAQCPPRPVVFQWHGDTFDLPPEAVLLATSPLCRHQAFRIGRQAYGLQFHIEMTAELIDTWLAYPENDAELAGLPYIDPQQIRQQTPAMLPRLQAVGSEVLCRFARLCCDRSGRPA